MDARPASAGRERRRGAGRREKRFGRTGGFASQAAGRRSRRANEAGQAVGQLPTEHGTGANSTSKNPPRLGTKGACQDPVMLPRQPGASRRSSQASRPTAGSLRLRKASQSLRLIGKGSLAMAGWLPHSPYTA